MKTWMFTVAAAVAIGARTLAAPPDGGAPPHAAPAPAAPATVTRTDAEWRRTLTPREYRVLRQKDTERPFTGQYWNLREDGAYTCAGCGQTLFKSTDKFDAGCGWPSFSDAIAGGRIRTAVDTSLGMRRIEVMCSRCGGHLGHVFDDGPAPTGQRYCINSASLHFVKKAAAAPAKAAPAARPGTAGKTAGDR